MSGYFARTDYWPPVWGKQHLPLFSEQQFPRQSIHEPVMANAKP
jgi:hypothetical protein